MKLRLFKRYFFLLGVIICICLVSVFMILTFVVNNYVVEDTYKSLNQGCIQIAETISENVSFFSAYAVIHAKSRAVV